MTLELGSLVVAKHDSSSEVVMSIIEESVALEEVKFPPSHEGQ